MFWLGCGGGAFCLSERKRKRKHTRPPALHATRPRLPAPRQQQNKQQNPTNPHKTKPTPTQTVSGVGAELAAFCGRHPDALRDILLFCACGAAGQLFIFFTIKRFGALTNTLICTTRKFFTILFSVVLVGNPLLPAQWGAVALVFGGLIASTLAAGGKKHHQHHHHDAAAAAAGGGGGAGKKAR